MKKQIFLTLVFTALLTSFLALNVSTSRAQIAPQPCDTRFWDQMSARAWMEAEREIMQNQNLIFKPDSVLEYVCFDQFASINAHVAGPIFTHTTYFGQQIIPLSSPQGLPKSLTNVVSTALNNYISSNYDHTFLGGRADKLSIPNKDVQLKNADTNVAYTCKHMAEIWKTAKCLNFVDNADFELSDGFYPFEDLAAGPTGGGPVAGYQSIRNTRNFPAGSKWNCGNNLGVAGNWSNQISLASNASGTLYPFQQPLRNIYQNVQQMVKPIKKKSNCQPPIPTGVTVYLQGGDPKGSHLDGVCTNPGCSYKKGSASSIGTCE